MDAMLVASILILIAGLIGLVFYYREEAKSIQKKFDAYIKSVELEKERIIKRDKAWKELRWKIELNKQHES